MTTAKIDMDHFSIDLETLHTRYNAAILSIGVAQFNPDTAKIGMTFYREIDFDSAIKYGHVSADTLRWWINQDSKAKRVFGNEGKVVLVQALDELTTWMRDRCMAPKVWGNGSTFDITILEHAYDKGSVGLKEPWHYTNIRDMRTLVDLAGYGATAWPFPRTGVPHNALDDAVFQAGVISACWQKVRKSIGPHDAREKKFVKNENQPVEKPEVEDF